MKDVRGGGGLVGWFDQAAAVSCPIAREANTQDSHLAAVIVFDIDKYAMTSLYEALLRIAGLDQSSTLLDVLLLVIIIQMYTVSIPLVLYAGTHLCTVFCLLAPCWSPGRECMKEK